MFIHFTEKKQQGFSLIEVLIAVLITALGLVASLALMISMSRVQQNAHQESVALNQANFIIDKMRANFVAPSAYHTKEKDSYAAATPAAQKFTLSSSCRHQVVGGLLTGGCSPEEMAQEDINIWIRSLQDRLPEGRGIIKKASDRADALDNRLHVIVMWQTRPEMVKDDGNAADRSALVDKRCPKDIQDNASKYNCYVIEVEL